MTELILVWNLIKIGFIGAGIVLCILIGVATACVLAYFLAQLVRCLFNKAVEAYREEPKDG